MGRGCRVKEIFLGRVEQSGRVNQTGEEITRGKKISEVANILEALTDGLNFARSKLGLIRRADLRDQVA